MSNLPRGDISREEREDRLLRRPPAESAKSSTAEAGDTVDSGRGNIRRGIIALLITAGAIVALNEASKYQLPTAKDVEEWTKNNLHGQLFQK